MRDAHVLDDTFTPPADLDPVALLEEHLAVGWEYDNPVRTPAPAAWEWHNRYQRPWRTTTAHGSTSATHSDPASER